MVWYGVGNGSRKRKRGGEGDGEDEEGGEDYHDCHAVLYLGFTLTILGRQWDPDTW